MILQGRQGCVRMEEFNFSDRGGVCRAVACPEHAWVTFTWAARNVRSLIPEQDWGRTEALRFRTALPKSSAQLMPNPGGNEVLFLGCQRLKVQDILPFTYPQPPQVGSSVPVFPLDPVLEFVAQTRFRARRDPRPRLRSLLRAHPTHTKRLWFLTSRCCNRSSKTGQQVGGARRYPTALRRVQALGKHDPFLFLRLDTVPESAVTQLLRGRREGTSCKCLSTSPACAKPLTAFA